MILYFFCIGLVMVLGHLMLKYLKQQYNHDSDFKGYYYYSMSYGKHLCTVFNCKNSIMLLLYLIASGHKIGHVKTKRKY